VSSTRCPADTSFSLPHIIGRMEGQTPHPTQGLQGSVFRRDTLADVPSTERPRAQFAFQNLMAHGILQFTLGITFFYVLHQCESQYIRCRGSYAFSQHRSAGLVHQAEHSPERATQYSLMPYSTVGSFRPRPLHQKEKGLWRETVLGPPPNAMDDIFTVYFCLGRNNDPSAGSPTKTLLQLLLPLNDKVQWTSHGVEGGKPPSSP
jgi:hypothetical protein